MISDFKKNRINLFDLKDNKDLINVEKKFHSFLKKIFRNKKNNSKYFFKNKKCACGSTKNVKKIKINFFEYVKCQCGSFFVNPMLKENLLNLVYSNNGPYNLYRKKFFEKKTKKKIRTNFVNKRKAEQVLNVLKNTNKRLLDFGCGNGDFLKACKKKGMKKLYGTDPKYLKKFEKKGITYLNYIDTLKTELKFDCITLWGVLEHLNDPIRFSYRISRLLAKNGFLILEVPNADSLLMNYVNFTEKNLIRFTEPGRHLFFFSKLFFKIYSKKLNLKLIDLETNGLDLQTVIGPTGKSLTKKILLFQNVIDELKISDHFRVVFKKL